MSNYKISSLIKKMAKVKRAFSPRHVDFDFIKVNGFGWAVLARAATPAEYVIPAYSPGENLLGINVFVSDEIPQDEVQFWSGNLKDGECVAKFNLDVLRR